MLFRKLAKDSHLEIKLLPDMPKEKRDEFEKQLKINLERAQGIDSVQLTSMTIVLVQRTAQTVAALMILRTICRIAEKRLG